jgi:selenide,water dikinase
MTDPQTSGGLLIACAPERSEPILRMIAQEGYPAVSIIGHTETGRAKVRLS